MKYLIYILIGMTTISCSTKKPAASAKKELNTEMNTTEKTILVNYQKVDCQGEGITKCLQIKELMEGIVPEKWSIYYEEIEGFTYEPGFIYRLKITEVKLNPDEVPADASYIKRILIEVLEKTKTVISTLNGKWKAISIKNVEDKLMLNVSPFIVLNDGKLNGSDGCNRMFSSYKTNSNSISFTAFGSTKMACKGENLNKVSRGFYKNIETVSTYKIEGNKLFFMNEKGELVITFLKK